MNDGEELCLCFHVSRRKVINFIRIEKPKRPAQLSECFGAGTGCGWCIPFLKQIFKQAEIGIDAEEYAKQRAEYVKSGKGTPPPGAEPLPMAGDGS